MDPSSSGVSTHLQEALMGPSGRCRPGERYSIVEGSGGGLYLTAQGGELAEGDDEIVEDVTEAIMSRYHCTFPEREKDLKT